MVSLPRGSRARPTTCSWTRPKTFLPPTCTAADTRDDVVITAGSDRHPSRVEIGESLRACTRSVLFEQGDGRFQVFKQAVSQVGCLLDGQQLPHRCLSTFRSIRTFPMIASRRARNQHSAASHIRWWSLEVWHTP